MMGKINVLIWSIMMEGEFMSQKNRFPEVMVFACLNGSGKTTVGL